MFFATVLIHELRHRLWKSKNARKETLRIVVLDEKNREEVQKLVSLVYTLAEVRVYTTKQEPPHENLDVNLFSEKIIKI